MDWSDEKAVRAAYPRIDEMIRAMAERQLRIKWAFNEHFEALQVRKAKAYAKGIAQGRRCLALVSVDPDHLAEYSIEANLDPELVREALSTDAGARLGLMMAGQMRSTGELDQVRTSWMMPDLLKLIQVSIASGSMSDSTAIKVSEAFGKQTARVGDQREAETVPLPGAKFVGTAADLVEHLTDPAPFKRDLPPSDEDIFRMYDEAVERIRIQRAEKG